MQHGPDHTDHNNSSEDDLSFPPPSPSSPPYGIRLRDGSFLRAAGPHIMGILNVTPDSFSDGGRFKGDTGKAVAHGLEMIRDGARIIDVGGESTRPNSEIVDVEREIQRVVPVIKGLTDQIQDELSPSGPSPLISIDTRKPEVARAALEAGADIINDINGLRADGMAEVAAEFEVPVVIMHMQGTPQTMQLSPHYEDVVAEIQSFLQERANFALEHGIKKDRIIIDPGIGFGKTLAHNLSILNQIHRFTTIGYPVLIGTSNKSIVGKVLAVPMGERREGTLATIVYSIIQNVSIIRVHDVKASVRVAQMTKAIMNAHV